MVRNMIRFYGSELPAFRPAIKLQDHPLSAARDCSCSIFAATLHFGGRSFIRNLSTRHTVVTPAYHGLLFALCFVKESG
jgi:hypothetical protein